MKITAVRCAVLGRSPVIRIVTDEGVDGYGEIEATKTYLKAVVPIFEPYLFGQDPTNVEAALLKIRRLGGNKPWGSVVSAIACTTAVFGSRATATSPPTSPNACSA